MANSYVEYTSSACVQYKISCGTLVRGTHGSLCVQNIYFMIHLHVEHIGSACLQDRTSLFDTFSHHSKLC